MALPQQVSVCLSYLTVLLWGTVEKSYFCFGPIWGGFLDPFLGAAFLLGLIEAWRARSQAAMIWGGAALVLHLIPGIISNDLEMFRISLSIPFVVWVAASGIQKLVLQSSTSRFLPLFILIPICFSIVLNLYHLLGPYHQWATPGLENSFSKSPERYRAFPILQREAEQQGPGLILTEFVPNVFDQSLLIASYPFNAARNPRFDPHQAHWVGILSTSSQRAYLSKRFPLSRWYNISTDIRRYDEAWSLGILPLKSSSAALFDSWVNLNRLLQSLYPLIPYDTDHPDYDPILNSLLGIYGTFKQDPFLEACLREKIAQYEFSSGRLEEFLRSIKPLLTSGFTSGLLYRREGVALLTLGFPEQASQAFKTAARLNPLNRLPMDILQKLENPKK